MITLRLTDMATVPHTVVHISLDVDDPEEGDITEIVDMLRPTIRVERIAAPELVREAANEEPRAKKRKARSSSSLPPVRHLAKCVADPTCGGKPSSRRKNLCVSHFAAQKNGVPSAPPSEPTAAA